MFFDRIKTEGPICLGIDPHSVNLPDFMKDEWEKNGGVSFLKKFGFSLIEAGHQAKLSCVKIQMAFFEVFGAEGWTAMAQVAAEARAKNLGVLLDGKRGDISSTMAAYGQACFDHLKADAMTVMPYMGNDTFGALIPWMKKGKAVYSVCLPSNPSAAIYLNDAASRAFALKMAKENYLMLEREQVAKQIGFVVGLSRFSSWVDIAPEEVKNSPLLMPGYGAQGAILSENDLALLSRRKADLVPISRGISGFGDGHLDPSLNQLTAWDQYQEWVFKKIMLFKNELSF